MSFLDYLKKGLKKLGTDSINGKILIFVIGLFNKEN